MNKHRKQLCTAGISFLWGVLYFSGSLLFAQQPAGLEGYLNYPLDKSFVVYDFGDNVNEIENLHSYITKTLSDPSLTVRDIEIVGYSSPEGGYGHNETLAGNRAESLKKYLTPFFPGREIRIRCIPEDWQGLVDVLARANYKQVDAVREIALSDQTPEQKERRLKKLTRQVYKDLSRNYFPLLRRASLTIYCDKTIEAEPEQEADHSPVLEEENEQEAYLNAQRNNRQYGNAQSYRQNIQSTALADRYGSSYYGRAKRLSGRAVSWNDFTPVVAVGTNLLQWAGFRPDFTHTTFIPNIYVEYYFLKRWSVKGAFAYCNRSYDDDKRFQGISSYSVEPRFWLREDGSFRGFFFGVYGEFGDYNQQEPDNSYTGRFHSEGISVGYLYPLYKGLAVELSLRGGYRYSTVKKYNAGEECNNLCRKYKKRDYTATGSCVSLIYRF